MFRRPASPPRPTAPPRHPWSRLRRRSPVRGTRRLGAPLPRRWRRKGHSGRRTPLRGRPPPAWSGAGVRGRRRRSPRPCDAAASKRPPSTFWPPPGTADQFCGDFSRESWSAGSLPALAAARLRLRRRSQDGVLALHRLGLDELLEPVLAALTSITRLLVAAEGRARIERPAVDVDLTGPHLPRHLLGPGRIAAPHSAGQAVGGVVGDLNRLFLGVVGDDGEDRAKDLLRAMVMSRVTSEKTVGWTKKPFSSPSGASAPPMTSLAPSSIPLLM